MSVHPGSKPARSGFTPNYNIEGPARPGESKAAVSPKSTSTDHPSDARNDPSFGSTDPARGTHKPTARPPLVDNRPAGPMQFHGLKPDLPYYSRDVDTFVGTTPKDLTSVQLNRALVPGLKQKAR